MKPLAVYMPCSTIPSEVVALVWLAQIRPGAVSEDVWPGLALSGPVVTSFVTYRPALPGRGGPTASRVEPQDHADADASVGTVSDRARCHGAAVTDAAALCASPILYA